MRPAAATVKTTIEASTEEAFLHIVPIDLASIFTGCRQRRGCKTTGTVEGVTDTVARYCTFTSGKEESENCLTMAVTKRVHNSSAK